MELDEVVSSLDRSIRHWHGLKSCQDTHSISTGSLGLDLALGGGWRRGKVAELSGDYSSYKTSLALRTVAQAQKSGEVLWLDSASEYNQQLAKAAGVIPEGLIVARPSSAEQAMFLMREHAQEFVLMVLDTASGLDFSSDNDFKGQEFQWLKADLGTSSVALFISNERATSDQAFTRELRKWSSQQVVMSPKGSGRVEAVVRKNHQTSPHWHRCQLRFLSDASFDAEYELVKLGLETGVIEKRGSWLQYNGYLLGQGIDGVSAALRAEYELAHGIREAIKVALQ